MLPSFAAVVIAYVCMLAGGLFFLGTRRDIWEGDWLGRGPVDAAGLADDDELGNGSVDGDAGAGGDAEGSGGMDGGNDGP